MGQITSVDLVPSSIVSGGITTATIEFQSEGGNIAISCSTAAVSPTSVPAPAGNSSVTVDLQVTGPAGQHTILFALDASVAAHGLTLFTQPALHAIHLISGSRGAVSASVRYSAKKRAKLRLQPDKGFRVTPAQIELPPGHNKVSRIHRLQVQRIGNHRRAPAVTLTLGKTEARVKIPRSPHKGKR